MQKIGYGLHEAGLTLEIFVESSHKCYYIHNINKESRSGISSNIREIFETKWWWLELRDATYNRGSTVSLCLFYHI